MEIAPEKIIVTKLYLLVHPGFCAGPDLEHDPGHPNAKEIEASCVLLEKYINKAEKLSRSDMMVVFGYASSEEFERHKENGETYAGHIDKLQKILGDRLILVHDNLDPFEDDHAFEEVEFIAEERGFSINSHTLTEAFGETAQICVLDAAVNFNKTGRFLNKTIIDLDFTDLFNVDISSTYISSLIKGNKDSISRVLFSKNGRIIS